MLCCEASMPRKAKCSQCDSGIDIIIFLESIMNIDNLTFGELKQIAAIFTATQQHDAKVAAHSFIGMHVIARCYAAGVHAGTVVSADGESVVLKDSVRLWSWKAKDGIALSGVAQNGVKEGCKIDTKNPFIYLTGVCELIPTTQKSMESIHG